MSSPTKKNISTILDTYNTGIFNISGSLIWLSPESITSKEGKTREKRVRNGKITDSTGNKETSLWHQEIDQIEEGQFYNLTNCRTKYFYGEKTVHHRRNSNHNCPLKATNFIG